MSMSWDWSPALNAFNQFAKQQEYNKTIKQMFGSPQINPVQVTAPVSQPNLPQMQGGTLLNDPSRQAAYNAPTQSYSGPVGQSLGFDQSAALAPLLQGLDPSMGMPLLLQTLQSSMAHKQALADKKITPISDQEAKGLGLRPDGVYGRDAAGNITTIQASDMKSVGAMKQGLDEKAAENQLPMNSYQAAEVANAKAMEAEKAREFNASNPMLASGGGAGPSPDINSYPPATKGVVQAMLDGRQAPPSSFALSKPYWQNMLAIANTIDPGFDQTTWGARASARKDFLGGGKSYQTLNSGNTAIQHLGHLNDQIGDVAGHQIPLIGNMVNSGENALAQASGVPGVNAYNDTLGHLAEETTKFYRGTGGSETDIARNMSNLSPNLSSETKKAGVKNTVELVYGKLAPMVEQYNKTMNTNYTPSHFLSSQAIATMKKMGFDPDTGQPVSATTGTGGWSIKLKGQ